MTEQVYTAGLGGLVRIRSGDGVLHLVVPSLLESSPYFKAILEKRWCINAMGEIEVCCASESFTNLLNVLRYGQEAVSDLSMSARFMLCRDMNYFQFNEKLYDKIKYVPRISRPCMAQNK